MSHFSVMVVGNVDHNLAPFHEFECTGVNDEFVQDIDQTAEYREGYETKDAVLVIERADGTRFGAFDGVEYVEELKAFQRNKNKALKKEDLPEGWKMLCDVPAKEALTFLQFVREHTSRPVIDQTAEPDIQGDHKWGYIRVDSEGEVVCVIDRTNPNKKWDWYVTGGRWSNHLLLKDGTRADSARKDQIDWEGMRAEARQEALDDWEEVRRPDGSCWWFPVDVFLNTLEQLGLEEDAEARKRVRDAYNQQPELQELRKLCPNHLFDADRYLVPREVFGERAADDAIRTYAMVIDREWFARGDMGWFGMSNDTESRESWNKRQWAAIEGLPDDAVITIVDCHT